MDAQSATGTVFCPDISAAAGDDALSDSQTQAVAFAFIVEAAERFENPLQVFRRDTGSGIKNAYLAIVGHDLLFKTDRGLLRGVAQGVTQDIFKRPVQ